MSKETKPNYEELYNGLKKDYDALLESYNSIIQKRKKYSKEYHQKNRERCAQYAKAYYQKNRERCAQYAKEYHKRKKEEKQCQKDLSAASVESK